MGRVFCSVVIVWAVFVSVKKTFDRESLGSLLGVICFSVGGVFLVDVCMG